MGRVYLATGTARTPGRLSAGAAPDQRVASRHRREGARRRARAFRNLRSRARRDRRAALSRRARRRPSHAADEMSGGGRPTPGRLPRPPRARRRWRARTQRHLRIATSAENVMRHSDGRLGSRLRPGADAGLRETGSLGDCRRRALVRAVKPVAGAAERTACRTRSGRVRVRRGGVIAFTSGAHPFHASTPLGLAARVLSEADPIATRCRHNPGVRRRRRRSLPESGRRRFASAADVLRALQGWRAPSPICRAVEFLTMWRVHQLVTMAL
jgi:hypothetical protein